VGARRLPFGRKEVIVCKYRCHCQALFPQLEILQTRDSCDNLNAPGSIGVCLWQHVIWTISRIAAAMNVDPGGVNHHDAPTTTRRADRLFRQQERAAWYLSGDFMKSFNANDLRLLNAWLDPELEAALGYRLFSNPQAAATPYTRQTR